MSPNTDRRVIAWLIDQLSEYDDAPCPPGSHPVVLVGGCFDGCQFHLPDTPRVDELSLPTTPIDRPGGPCYAIYVMDASGHRARFARIVVGSIANPANLRDDLN